MGDFGDVVELCRFVFNPLKCSGIGRLHL